MDLPNDLSIVPNVSISFSPAKNPSTPPELGIVDAMSAIILPAFAAASTALASTLPATVDENSAIAFPNETNCVPNLSMELSPPIHELMFDNKSAAVIIIMVSASALTPSIMSGLISNAAVKNGIAFIINCDNSVPKFAKLLQIGLNVIMLDTKSAAVSNNMPAVSAPTFATKSIGSTADKEVMNG